MAKLIVGICALGCAAYSFIVILSELIFPAFALFWSDVLDAFVGAFFLWIVGLILGITTSLLSYASLESAPLERKAKAAKNTGYHCYHGMCCDRSTNICRNHFFYSVYLSI